MRRPLLVLPTGTRKPIVFAHLLAQWPGRALVLWHRDELVRQAADKLRMVAPSLNIGIIKADADEVDAAVVVASVQTLSRPNWLKRLSPDLATVVVDEAQHATAPTYQRILEYGGSFREDGPLTLGVSATPERADRVGLAKVWQIIVYQKGILEMILAGYLAEAEAAVAQPGGFDGAGWGRSPAGAGLPGRSTPRHLVPGSGPAVDVAVQAQAAYPDRKAVRRTDGPQRRAKWSAESCPD